jgi:hypothetical protein
VVRQVSAWGTKFEPERKNSMLRCVVRLLYGAGRVPRHDLEQGEVDSTKGRSSTASPWPPVHGGDEDDPLLDDFFTKGYGGLLGWLMGCGLGRAAGLLVG